MNKKLIIMGKTRIIGADSTYSNIPNDPFQWIVIQQGKHSSGESLLRFSKKKIIFGMVIKMKITQNKKNSPIFR